MINPSWLKTFCALADIGHFTKTAESLFMTQSGVSQHIKKLEQQLDTALLIREGKSFSLTEAGMKLHQQGRELLQSSEDLVTLIKQDEPCIGTVKIASPGSIGLKLYPYLLNLQQKNPQLIIDYAFAPNHTIEQNLAERSIDIGLVTELSHVSTLAYTKVALEPLVLVTPENIKTVSWQVLTKLGFIAHPDASHHAQLLLSKNFPEFEHIQQFTHKGFSNQISLILEPVSRGLGFSVLPLHAANAFSNQAAIKIHTLPQPVSESLYLCTNRQAYQTKRNQYIKSLVLEYLS